MDQEKNKFKAPINELSSKRDQELRSMMKIKYHKKSLSQNKRLLDQSKRREDHENSLSHSKKILDKSRTKYKSERKKKLISKYASPKLKIIWGIYRRKKSNKDLVGPRSPSMSL
jgi:hypothetical protein